VYFKIIILIFQGNHNREKNFPFSQRKTPDKDLGTETKKNMGKNMDQGRRKS
jgi:hypothetical protein